MRPLPLKFLYLVALSRGRGQHIGCKKSMLLGVPCYIIATVYSCYSPVSWSGFRKWVLSCCACSVKNRLFSAPVLPRFCLKKTAVFVLLLFYFCSTLKAGYRSPIVLLFKSWSKKSLLAKIKQRGSGELLAPAPPLPLLGGFILFFLRACPLLFIGSGFSFLCSGFKSGGLVWCSQNIKLYVELYKGTVVRSK